MSKLYGNITNRMMENQSVVDEIKIGTPITECMWSDRVVYEVVAVKDQNHFTMRRMDAKASERGKELGMGHQDWVLTSNEKNDTTDVAKRKKGYYEVRSYMDENGKKHTKSEKINLIVGVADYYYDWEF